MRSLLLCVLAPLPLAASAAGSRELQPLIGTWEGTLKCKDGQAQPITARFNKIKEGVVFSYSAGTARGDGILLPSGGSGRYKTVMIVAGDELLTRLGLDKVPATLTVSDDEGDELSAGDDYYTYSAGVAQTARFLGSAKLKGDRRTITYQVKTETPIGRDLCSGVLKKKTVKDRA